MSDVKLETTSNALPFTAPASLDAPSQAAFTGLLAAWAEEQTRKWEYRQNTAEPAELAYGDLRRFLVNLGGVNPRTAEYARAWAEAPGREVMRVFLADPTGGDAEEFFAGLALAPNRLFFWRLVQPSYHGGALNMGSFRQMLWVQRFEFINDCMHVFGRPLPIMELADLSHGNTDCEAFEALVKHVLKPSELMFAIGHGVFQLTVTESFEAGYVEKERVRMTLNPLFTQSR